MPFPQVKSRLANDPDLSSDTQTFQLPDANAGDLLLLFVTGATTYAAPVVLDSGGFTTESTLVRLLCFTKTATGSENNQVTMRFTSSMKMASIAYCIAAGSWYEVEVLDGANGGTSQYPDPDPLTPTWDDGANLWIAAADTESSVVTAAPSNYTNLTTIEPGAGGADDLGVAERERLIGTEDPGTFTTASSQVWRTETVAVRGKVTGGWGVITI